MDVRTPADDPWFAATWEGAEAATLELGRRLTLAERLRWLEEASRAARALAGVRAGALQSAAGDETQLPVGFR